MSRAWPRRTLDMIYGSLWWESAINHSVLQRIRAREEEGVSSLPLESINFITDTRTPRRPGQWSVITGRYARDFNICKFILTCCFNFQCWFICSLKLYQSSGQQITRSTWEVASGCTTNRTHLPRAPDVSIGKHKSVDKPSAVVRSWIRFNLSDSTTATSLPKTRVVYGKRDTTSSSPPVRCRCLFIRVYQRAIPVYQGETVRIKMTT